VLDSTSLRLSAFAFCAYPYNEEIKVRKIKKMMVGLRGVINGGFHVKDTKRIGIVEKIITRT